MPHQLQAVDKLASCDRAMLCDDTGLGKTRTAIAWAIARGAKRVAVAAPRILHSKWADEIRIEQPKADVCTDYDFGGDWMVSTEWSLCSTDMRAGSHRALVDWKPDALIVDESHMLKSVGAQRAVRWRNTVHELESSGTLKSAMAITATPLTKDPSDILTQMHTIGIEGLKTAKELRTAMSRFITWKDEYVYSGYSRRVQDGWTEAGVEFVMDAMSKHGVMRLKVDVLPNLPELRKQIVDIEVESGDLTYWASKIRDIRMSRNDVDIAGDASEDPSTVSDLVYACGLAKAPKIRDWLAASDDQVVVFSRHTSVADEVVAELDDAVVCTGNLNAKERNRHAKSFEEGKVRILSCTYGAMGVGIDLTAGKRVVLAELDYSPSVEKQALDRIHRIGQDSTCIAQVCVAHWEGLSIGKRVKFERRILDIQDKKRELAKMAGLNL